ncbi:MAG: hypothetical protein J6V25_09460, partial [Oscillospiraceae bacterium]|nr:hypothetical protein [Oscillospiraceae bacterium]
MATYYGEDIFFLMSALTSSIPSLLLSIAAYVLTAIALYTMAKSRGLSKAWMAWVPVLDSWILGSLSDQYQYLVKGQNKNKRKVLLILNVVMLVMFLLIMILVAVMATGAIFAASEAGAMSS